MLLLLMVVLRLLQYNNTTTSPTVQYVFVIKRDFKNKSWSTSFILTKSISVSLFTLTQRSSIQQLHNTDNFT